MAFSGVFQASLIIIDIPGICGEGLHWVSGGYPWIWYVHDTRVLLGVQPQVPCWRRGLSPLEAVAFGSSSTVDEIFSSAQRQG